MKRGDGDPGHVKSRRGTLTFGQLCGSLMSSLLGVPSAKQTHAKLVHMQALRAPYQVVYKSRLTKTGFSSLPMSRLQDSKTPSSLLLAVGTVDSVQGRGCVEVYSLSTPHHDKSC